MYRVPKLFLATLATMFILLVAVSVVFGDGSRWTGEKWSAPSTGDERVSFDLVRSSFPDWMEQHIVRAAERWDNNAALDLYEAGSGSHHFSSVDFDDTVWPDTWAAATTRNFEEPNESPSSGFLSDVDTYFNSDWNWNTNCTFSSMQADIRVVALHEAGHWMRLVDKCGGGTSVMCYNDMESQCLTSPTSDDYTQLRKVYGR
jgi:hypothetical protein